jgi:hypothetical protein
MKKILHFLLLGMLLTTAAQAQTLTVQGYVRDLSQVAIPNQAVLIDYSPNIAGTDTVLTDASGFFSATYTLNPGTSQGTILVRTYCSATLMDSAAGFYSTGNLTLNFNLVCGGTTPPPGNSGWLNGWVSPTSPGDTVDVSLYALRNGMVTLDTMIRVADTVSFGLVYYGFRRAPGNYIVKAELSGGPNAGNYVGTYYGQTSLQQQATIVNIVSGQSTNNININLLTTATPTYYFVSGFVNGFQPSTSLMDTVRVILMSVDTNGWTPVDTVLALDSIRNGNAFYWFRTTQLGNYSILATLISGNNQGNYLPTYYGDVSSWSNAALINFTPAIVQIAANISLLPANGTGGGSARIRGNIFPGRQITNSGTIAGVQIQLLDMQGQVLAATHSQNDGSYQFESLAFGDYKLRVEWPGMASAEHMVQLTAGNPEANGINFSMSSSGITTSIDQPQLSISGLYPNPAREKVTLNLTAKSGVQQTLYLRDLQGRTLKTLPIQLESGQHPTEISLEGLAPGLYFIEIDGRHPQRSKLIVQ